jgi:hypothetical protein
MKNRLLLLILILFMGPVFTNAQGITTVTATIVDPNGIPWAGATVQAQLLPNGITPRIPPPCSGQNASPCFPSGFLVGSVSSLGTFSMSLADNGVLLPSGTTWQFTVSTNGAPSPLGTGPQSFTVTTPINCGTNTPATCTGGTINISATLGPVPALGFGGSLAAVILKTPTGSNQTITPGDTTSVPLTIVGASGTSVDLFDVEVNGGNKAFSVNNLGTVLSSTAGTLSMAVGVGGNVNIQGVNASNMFLKSSTGTLANISLLAGTATMGASASFHMVQNAANSDFAGVLTCAGGTVTKTFVTAYTTGYWIQVFDETTAGGVRLSSKTLSGFTVACTGATDVVDYTIGGNQN